MERSEVEILRIREVVRRTALSRTTIWRQVRMGQFPSPLQLTENSIGWPSSEIEQWLADRPRVNYALNTALMKAPTREPCQLRLKISHFC